MTDPAITPPCPACGCTSVIAIFAEPDPGESTLEAALSIQSGHRGMYADRKNLVRILACAGCGNDMTEIRRRVTPSSFETILQSKAAFNRLAKAFAESGIPFPFLRK